MEKEIGRIKKSDTADIVVQLDEFGGEIGLNIREFANGKRYQGFTKAGVRIKAKDFKVFKEFINSIDEKDFGVKDESI